MRLISLFWIPLGLLALSIGLITLLFGIDDRGIWPVPGSVLEVLDWVMKGSVGSVMTLLGQGSHWNRSAQ